MPKPSKKPPIVMCLKLSTQERYPQSRLNHSAEKCACLGVNNIGKPCAGKLHARFDEGGQAKDCSLLYPTVCGRRLAVGSPARPSLSGGRQVSRSHGKARGGTRQASHRQPSRPDAEAVLTAVAKAFCVMPEQVQNRRHQRAFQAWVYLLPRAVNLSLREVADKAGVSSGRISQIQRTI